MRVLGMEYSHEKYVKSLFYSQFLSDQIIYEFLVDNTSESSSQQLNT